MSSAPVSGVRLRLQVRLAVTFALFGTAVSLLLSAGVFVTAKRTGDRLMDETLRAELEDYVARRARNPASLPPATIGLRGFVYAPDGSASEVPAEVRALVPGQHRVSLLAVPYRVLVSDRGGQRYVMMFSELHQRRREAEFFVYLGVGTLLMALVSAAIGWWLAGRVVAPVAELARRISATPPERDAEDPESAFSDDEIGKLASGVFGEYARRMRAFIEREQAFTADVSHELRTPLSIVQGVVELLEADHSLEEPQRERVGRIRRAVQEMIDVTSALLLMARDESGDRRMLDQCDVCEVVEDIIESHRHLVSADTTVHLHCSNPQFIVAHAILLKIVVANLVRNAFAHTRSGTVDVVIDEDCITVTDTGSGIPGDQLGRVFQRHFKGSGSTGAGIGLSLVKRICDRYGWETMIDSRFGEGTRAQLVYASSRVTPALTLS